MKKYISRLVEGYYATLMLKRSHKKTINIRSFVLESILIVFILLLFVGGVGFIYRLYLNEIYIKTATIVLLIFGYMFITWLYEVRYQYVNELEYNPWPYILYQVHSLVVGLVVATTLSWIMSNSLVLFKDNPDNVVGHVTLVVVVYLIIEIVIAQVSYVKNHFHLGFVIWLIFYALQTLFGGYSPFGYIVIVLLIISILVIQKRFLNVYEFIPIREEVVLLLFLVFMVMLVRGTYDFYSILNGPWEDGFDEKDVVAVNDEYNIYTMITNDKFVYAVALTVNGSTVIIMDQDFEVIAETNLISDTVTIFVEDDVLYAFNSSQFLQINHDGTLTEIFTYPGEHDYIISVVPVLDQYFVITRSETLYFYNDETMMLEPYDYTQDLYVETENFKISVDDEVFEFYTTIPFTPYRQAVSVIPYVDEFPLHPTYDILAYYNGYEMRYYHNLDQYMIVSTEDVKERVRSEIETIYITSETEKDFIYNDRLSYADAEWTFSTSWVRNVFEIHGNTLYIKEYNTNQGFYSQQVTDVTVVDVYGNQKVMHSQFYENDGYLLNGSTIYLIDDGTVYQQSSLLVANDVPLHLQMYVLSLFFIVVLFPYKVAPVMRRGDYIE